MQRLVVLVSGAPGAGKSTLAAPLCTALGLPLLAKDVIKEALWDALDPPAGDLQWSRRIGDAAMDLLWRLAEDSPAVVLEANFRPHSEYQRSRLNALQARIVEVHCWCPPAEAMRRYAERAGGAERHGAHVLQSLDLPLIAEFDEPVGLGVVIRVDTTRPVDVPRLAGSVAAALGTGQRVPGQPPAIGPARDE